MQILKRITLRRVDTQPMAVLDRDLQVDEGPKMTAGFRAKDGKQELQMTSNSSLIMAGDRETGCLIILTMSLYCPHYDFMIIMMIL